MTSSCNLEFERDLEKAWIKQCYEGETDLGICDAVECKSTLPASKHATHLVRHMVQCQVNSAERRRKDQKVGKTVMDEKSFNYVRDNTKQSTYSISH